MRTLFTPMIYAAVLLMAVSACMPRPREQTPVPQAENWEHQLQHDAAALPPGAMPVQRDPLPAYGTRERVVKVALLVPLTGRSSEIGKALQDAAVLALFDKYTSMPPDALATRVELIPKDTKADPEQAAMVAQQAINEGAELILGPLFSESVKAVAPIAKAKAIPVISFSNNPRVGGDGVFLFGFQPDEQVTRIAEYLATRGLERVAVLSPSNAYAQSVVATLQAQTQIHPLTVEPVIYYSAAGGPVKAEVEQLLTQTRDGSVYTFDALFLPEGGEQLRGVWNELQANGVTTNTTKIIGTGLWDDPATRRGSDLSGAWYASAPADQYASFETRFITTYDYEPPRLASLAYDAVALAATLATVEGGYTRTVIADPSGYAGPANGIFRFRPEGTVERGLAVMEIRGGDLVVIDSAPSSFMRP